jgi:hypothetical protein
VLADALDVLVYPESGMHNVTYLMGALRLAPVQCCAWGHPDTTGHRNMDWFISCDPMETAGSAQRYRERLALLPGIGTRYEAARAPAGTSRAQLGLPDEGTLYLVPQSLFKIHPDNDELVARILAHDPAGVAVMFVSPQEAVTRAFAARLGRSLARVGLAIADRVLFLPRLSHDDYLRVNTACDLMLDTLHWSGGNTSLDAIACGLPIVTCPARSCAAARAPRCWESSACPSSSPPIPRSTSRSRRASAATSSGGGALAARMRAGHAALFGARRADARAGVVPRARRARSAELDRHRHLRARSRPGRPAKMRRSVGPLQRCARRAPYGATSTLATEMPANAGQVDESRAPGRQPVRVQPRDRIAHGAGDREREAERGHGADGAVDSHAAPREEGHADRGARRRRRGWTTADEDTRGRQAARAPGSARPAFGRSPKTICAVTPRGTRGRRP